MKKITILFRMNRQKEKFYSSRLLVSGGQIRGGGTINSFDQKTLAVATVTSIIMRLSFILKMY